MFKAFLLAAGQVLDPRSRSVVWRGVAGAAAVFVLLWIAVGWLLTSAALTGVVWLDWALDILGGLAVAVVSWMLFPAAVIAVSGFFINEVVDRAEALHYPGLPAPTRTPLSEEIAAALRLFGMALLINMAALPVYLATPLLNFPLYLAINGWLAGREYFELAAHRRMSSQDAAALRRARPAGVFFAGVCVVGLSTVPLINLLVPVIAGAFFVHVFHRMTGRRPGEA